LAEELKARFNLEPRLTAGSGGVFDVTVDGKTIFSKHELSRFPEEGEIVRMLEE